jgi:single-stranded-DNA-specific exonuclease
LKRLKKPKNLGIDFIICDHHRPGDILPPAVAVLDPKRSDCTYPFKELSGCGVGFKLLQGFCQFQGLPQDELYEYLDLLVVSIASDIVPISDENRILAYFGLEQLSNNPRPGLRALLDISGIKGELDITKLYLELGRALMPPEE